LRFFRPKKIDAIPDIAWREETMGIRPHDEFPARRSDSRVETEDLKPVRIIYHSDMIIRLRGASLFRIFFYYAGGPIDTPSVEDEDFALGQDPVVDKTIQRSEDPPRFVEAGHDYSDNRVQIFLLLRGAIN
jgi:hypothetical protein